jgi:hypothetical protein
VTSLFFQIWIQGKRDKGNSVECLDRTECRFVYGGRDEPAQCTDKDDASPGMILTNADDSAPDWNAPQQLDRLTPQPQPRPPESLQQSGNPASEGGRFCPELLSQQPPGFVAITSDTFLNCSHGHCFGGPVSRTLASSLEIVNHHCFWPLFLRSLLNSVFS